EGKYIIIGQVCFLSDDVGVRYIRIRLNDTTTLSQISMTKPGGGDTILNISTIYPLSADDYVELQLFQNSGDALDSRSQAERNPEFMMQRIG
ncbi:unnamed protein product, partial [marine sediment metagenome]